MKTLIVSTAACLGLILPTFGLGDPGIWTGLDLPSTYPHDVQVHSTQPGKNSVAKVPPAAVNQAPVPTRFTEQELQYFASNGVTVQTFSEGHDYVQVAPKRWRPIENFKGAVDEKEPPRDGADTTLSIINLGLYPWELDFVRKNGIHAAAPYRGEKLLQVRQDLWKRRENDTVAGFSNNYYSHTNPDYGSLTETYLYAGLDASDPTKGSLMYQGRMLPNMKKGEILVGSYYFLDKKGRQQGDPIRILDSKENLDRANNMLKTEIQGKLSKKRQEIRDRQMSVRELKTLQAEVEKQKRLEMNRLLHKPVGVEKNPRLTVEYHEYNGGQYADPEGLSKSIYTDLVPPRDLSGYRWMKLVVRGERKTNFELEFVVDRNRADNPNMGIFYKLDLRKQDSPQAYWLKLDDIDFRHIERIAVHYGKETWRNPLNDTDKNLTYFRVEFYK